MITEENLEALFVANPEFEAVERSQNVFCPFEAVGMVRQEIRHGNFLAYCLDPQRPHGFGSECLQALMRSAASARRLQMADIAVDSITPLTVHLMDFEKAQIRREWRNIDILVTVSDEKLVVAIELKIDSTEHSGQLSRYRELVEAQWSTKNGWRQLFLYLTTNGDEASEEDGEGWLALHLDMVALELDGVSQRQLGTPDAQTLLRAYLAMLRRHHLTNEHLEALAAKLWGQHREALDYLMARRPDATSGIFGQIFEHRERIAAKMAVACGLKIVTDESSASLIRFAIDNWDGLPDFLSAQRWTPSKRLMLIEVQGSGDKRNVRIRFVLGPADASVRNKYHQLLVGAGVPTTKKKTITASYTRLATRSMPINDEDEAEEDADPFDRFQTMATKFAAEIVRAYDEAFAPLRSA